MIRASLRNVGLAMLAALAIPAAMAQDDAVPRVDSIDTYVIPNRFVLPADGDLPNFRYDPTAPPLEAAIILMVVTVTDLDGVVDTEFFLRKSSVWDVTFGRAPEPPPVEGDSTNFIPRPPDRVIDFDTASFYFVYQLPLLNGPNQLRLRGEINFDVQWLVRFEVANDEAPAEENGVLPVGLGSTLLRCKDDPALNPPNPPPSADAGPDVSIDVNGTATLDGSQTFDGSNVGFDPFDPEVIEKDILTYTWEWVSGPVRVEPEYPDPAFEPYLAQVTLNTTGVYTYRLLVQDGVNPDVSVDTMTVTVSAPAPQNQAPVASITGPTASVVIGSIITLDGTLSSDPDGDALTFRWRQTDALGGEILPDDIGDQFQPLTGVSSPITQWQALQAGTYYVRLLVSDGRLTSTARFSVTVVNAESAGERITNDDPARAQTADADSANDAPLSGACGGGLLPLALTPFGLWAARRRFVR